MTTFTTDWVTSFIPSWTKHVVPELAGRMDVHWLEVGSYEGRSALWTLDHVLTGQGSSITCVDRWDREGELPGEAERNFDENTRERANLFKLRGLSEEILRNLSRGHFHGVYIDGSHAEEDVYRDACQILPLLRPGAFMIFDDYDANAGTPWTRSAGLEPTVRRFGVFVAANRFLKELGDRIVVLHAEWQLIAKLGGKP